MRTVKKIIETIGYKNFLKAEAYYYDSLNFGYFEEHNFYQHLDEFKNLLRAFVFYDTDEGVEFWAKLDTKIREELK